MKPIIQLIRSHMLVYDAYEQLKGINVYENSIWYLFKVIVVVRIELRLRAAVKCLYELSAIRMYIENYLYLWKSCNLDSSTQPKGLSSKNKL